MSRNSRYITIPLALWESDQLGWDEKVLMVEIDSLSTARGCRKTPGSLATSLRLPVKAVKDTLASLVAKGAVEQIATPEGELLYRANIDRKWVPSDSTLAKKAKEDNIDYDFVLSEWKRCCPGHPQPKAIAPKYQAKLRALLKNYNITITDFCKVFECIPCSAFLSGKSYSPGRKPFIARLDWLISDTGGAFMKTMSGAYHTGEEERAKFDEIFGEAKNEETEYYQ